MVKLIHLLIDTDALVWRYSLMPKDKGVFEFGGPPEEPIEIAQRAFREKLEYLKADYTTDTAEAKIVLCLPPEDSVNFRYKVFPDYKKHRGERPEIVTEMYKWVRQEFPHLIRSIPNVETDDIIAEEAFLCKLNSEGFIIVSNDKDFGQISGFHLHPFSGELKKVTHEESLLNFWYQMLVGDGADGIPGCPGIGDKKAVEILMEALKADQMEKIPYVVWFTYLSQGATTKDYEMNFCLLDLGIPTFDIMHLLGELPESYTKVLEEIYDKIHPLSLLW